MISLSLCMIVRDEEDVLARCLDSVTGIADEIVVVDTGSRDSTRAIALKYTGRVHDFAWADDFSAARNYAFSKATCQYIMWLDADDVLLPADRAALAALKAGLAPEADTVMMKYNVAFDSAGRPTFSYYRERLVRNCPQARWQGMVHEAITPFGRVVYSDIAISHKKEKPPASGRNLEIYQKALAAGRSLTPRELYYYGRELYYNGHVQEAAAVFEAFLAGGQGWIENNIDACRLLHACLLGLGRDKEALAALVGSFAYDCPRAEVCCDIGGYFFAGGGYRQAAFWYETALSRPRDDRTGAFVQAECYGFLPLMQLCVCWYHLGDAEKAREYNRRAGQINPTDPGYLANVQFFCGQQ